MHVLWHLKSFHKSELHDGSSVWDNQVAEKRNGGGGRRELGDKCNLTGILNGARNYGDVSEQTDRT